MRTKIKNNREAGYSMVELLLAVFVGSIVLAGGYASYAVIAAQYQRNSGVSDIRDFAVPTIKIINRDLRMAGYRAVDNNIESTFGRINPPITITNAANVCCDSFFVVYDKSLTSRIRVTYYVAARTSPSRNALFMDIAQWNGTTWVNQTTGAIVADYVEDFQIEGSQNNTSGFPTFIDYNLVFTSRNKTPTTNAFTKSSYASGDHDGYSVTDNYQREEFESSVRLRNLVDR